ncbi:UbiA family prenyltransferase [Thermoplasmatales archaeon AK]|nr:UbiA family prenyltransferase [Thermoplasmatales archaeon AK]
MNSWVRIIRPVNGIMGIVGTVVSAIIALGIDLTPRLVTVAIASVCVFLVISGGNVINDIVDVETDRINHPERPLPSGKISRNAALYFSVFSFGLAIVLSALFISVYSVILVILAEGLLVSYEIKTKKLGLTGNITISILVGLIFIFGGVSVGVVTRMVLLFIMATLANFSREIIKDIQDMEGDVDRKTFPRLHGVKSSAIIAIASVVAAVATSFVPYLLSIFNIYYIYAVVVSDVFFLISAALITRDAKRSQNVSKLAMILGLVSFAVGGVT